MSRAKAPGVIDCPEHGGRAGRCNHCSTRLRIAEDLSTLKTILASGTSRSSADSAESGSSSATSSTDDLIIGEKVFGVKFGRKTIFVIGLSVVAILLIATIAFVLQLQKPKEGESAAERFRTLEQ